jgi:menaquinone-specific isochorismate synthase
VSREEAYLLVVLDPREHAQDALARASRLTENLRARPPATFPRRARIAQRDSVGAWSNLVSKALKRIELGEADKIVLARRLELLLGAELNLSDALAELGSKEPSSIRFALALNETTSFFGATPEILVRRRGSRVETEALAGSFPRNGNDSDERARLLASEKDAREHAFVVEGIARELAPFTSRLEHQPRGVRTLSAVHHLATPISAELRTQAHVLELVRALHPTPAVAGAPKRVAQSWIVENEPEPRGYYAAPFGWIGPHGDGAFAVAIRSALVRGNQAWVHGGAGLVRGSTASAELAETDAKMRTLLSLLGVP